MVRSSDRARSIIIKSTDMMHIAIQQQIDARLWTKSAMNNTRPDLGVGQFRPLIHL
nr:hypothetical protein [Nostoc sp. DedQUE07]MDZ8127703.1 hypothetical protein [Nostoc sp. DedQUE07]